MQHLPFLEDFVIILVAAVLIVFVSRPFRLPSVVGFLLTGMLIGPSGLNFINDRTIVEVFAEIGVVMLLFVIGLEFSLAHLRSIWRQFLIAGGLQVGLTVLVVMLLFSLGTFSLSEKIFFGCLIALSSTAIVLKILTDRSEIDTPHGKLMIGVLLFQDFCIVPMIVFTPLLSGTAAVSVLDVLLRFSASIVAVGVVFYFSRSVMGRVLEQIVRTRVREAFLMGSLLICLLLAVTTASLGFSYALGAFIAGLIISETQYHVEVVAEIVPFRDLFTSLFFISVGMLLDLNFVAENSLTVFALGLGIFLVKASVVLAIALAMRSSPRTAIITGISLAQVGEFSFVLAQVGSTTGLLQEPFSQYFLSSSIFTMIISPPLIAFAPSLAERTQRLVPFAVRTDDHRPSSKPLADHVIIVGFGVNGQNLARVLKESGIPYVVIEADADAFRDLQREDHPLVFGDVTRREILFSCDIERARMIVFAISDPGATRTGVQLARSLNPNLHIIVRTRLLAEIDGLTKLGADEVIPEEFETSIEIFTRVLDHYHIPRNVVHAQIQVIRDENYSMLRGLPQTAKGLDRVARLLTAGTSDIFLVTDTCLAANRSVGDIDIPGKTSASLIAVVRNEKPFMTPARDFVIEPGDILVLVGNHASMDKAFDYLAQEPVPGPSSGGPTKEHS